MKMMQMNHTNQNLHTARRLHNSYNYVEAEEMYRALFLENKDAFERNDNVFFLKSINKSRINDNSSTYDLEKEANFVLENFNQEDCSNRIFIDPYAEILINIAKQYNNRTYYLKAITTIWNLKVDFLTTYNPVNSNGYTYSLKEKWYSSFIDSLMGMEKYDDAIKYVNEAMLELPNSKSNAKLWIRYKLAKIYHQLGNYEDDVEILEDIINVKKENYIYKLIADNYYALNDYDNALKYAIEAVLVNKNVQNNINTYMLLGDILDKKDLKEESIKHYYLVYTYRKANNHRIEDNLSQIIEKANLDMDNIDYRKIVKELIPLWNELKYDNMVRYSGTIKKVFEEKGIGFIRNDFDSNDTFFSFKDFKDSEDFIYPGTKVSFYIEESFDYSKGRESTKAVEIEVIY